MPTAGLEPAVPALEELCLIHWATRANTRNFFIVSFNRAPRNRAPRNRAPRNRAPRNRAPRNRAPRILDKGFEPLTFGS